MSNECCPVCLQFNAQGHAHEVEVPDEQGGLTSMMVRTHKPQRRRALSCMLVLVTRMCVSQVPDQLFMNGPLSFCESARVMYACMHGVHACMSLWCTRNRRWQRVRLGVCEQVRASLTSLMLHRCAPCNDGDSGNTGGDGEPRRSPPMHSTHPPRCLTLVSAPCSFCHASLHREMPRRVEMKSMGARV